MEYFPFDLPPSTFSITLGQEEDARTHFFSAAPIKYSAEQERLESIERDTGGGSGANEEGSSPGGTIKKRHGNVHVRGAGEVTDGIG